MARTDPRYRATYAETNMSDRWRGALEDTSYEEIVSKCNCEGFHKSPDEALECSARWIRGMYGTIR